MNPQVYVIIGFAFFIIALSTHTSNNGASHMVKKVQKNFNNYASVECGAKILGSNPEAKVHMILFFVHHTENICIIKKMKYVNVFYQQSTSAILMENMDLYMLNPCSNKIWYACVFILFLPYLPHI